MRSVLRAPVACALLLACATATADGVRMRPDRAIDPAAMQVREDPDWDTPPELVEGKAPVFPVSRLLSRASGKVVIAYTIGRDGRTRDFEVVSAPDPMFADHAIIAVREWVFRPATQGGEAVDARVRQSFEYQAR